jgi:hypothetical protein
MIHKVNSRHSCTGLIVVLFFIGLSCEEKEANEMPYDGTVKLKAEAGKASPSTLATTDGQLSEVGEFITLEQAKKWKQTFNLKNPTSAKFHFFGSKIIMQILSQPNVAGISLEYAINEDGHPQILIVGVDKKGRKMNAEDQLGYADRSFCPPCTIEDE